MKYIVQNSTLYYIYCSIPFITGPNFFLPQNKEKFKYLRIL